MVEMGMAVMKLNGLFSKKVSNFILTEFSMIFKINSALVYQ